MPLWTVQPFDVYRSIQRDGFARVDPGKLPPPWWVGNPYHWLIWQIGSRLTIPGYAVAAIGSLVRALNTRGVTS